MAANDIDLYSLERVKELEQEYSEQERAVLDILASAMRNPTPEAMADAARKLDAKCPSPEDKDEFYRYLTNVYEMMANIASSPSVSGEVQGYLVDVLKALEKHSRGLVSIYTRKARLWEDLPLLSMHVGDAFSDPVDIAAIEGKYQPEELTIWRNINSFVARLTEADIYGPSVHIMRAMTYALEEELSTFAHPGLKECRVQVACDWVQRCANLMLEWAQENIGVTDVSASNTSTYLPGGRLYKGPPTMCFQRWGFWIERFRVLGKRDSGLPEETRKAALEAVKVMNMVERSLGHTLAPIASEEPSEDPSEEFCIEISEVPSQDISDEQMEEPVEKVEGCTLALVASEEDPSEELSIEVSEEPMQEPSQESSQDISDEPMEDPIGETTDGPMAGTSHKPLEDTPTKSEPMQEVLEEPLDEPMADTSDKPVDETPKKPKFVHCVVCGF